MEVFFSDVKPEGVFFDVGVFELVAEVEAEVVASSDEGELPEVEADGTGL